MWRNTNIYRENGALYDIFIWKIFYVTTVLRIFNITKIELVLPTFKSWSVHKIIEYLALGLLCSLWNIYHSTTAYFFDPPCIYLQLKYTTRHWLISSGLQTRSRRSVVVMTTHYHVDSRETSLQAYYSSSPANMILNTATAIDASIRWSVQLNSTQRASTDAAVNTSMSASFQHNYIQIVHVLIYPRNPDRFRSGRLDILVHPELVLARFKLVNSINIENTLGEVTSQSLWSRYDRHFLGITRHIALG